MSGTVAEIEIEAIAPSGDVIIVVGSKNPLKFRVHSQCLKTASTVFAAMFNPNWREGQDLSEEAPKEVALPDEDAQAMRVILHILHFRPIPDPDAIRSPRLLLQLVVHADKYDLILALRPYVQRWVLECPTTSTQERIFCFAAVSQLPPDACEYSFIFPLVTKHSDSYFDFLEDELVQLAVNYRHIARLEEVRTRLRIKLIELVGQTSCDQKDCTLKYPFKCADGRVLNINQIRSMCAPEKILTCPAIDVVSSLMQFFGAPVQDAGDAPYTRHQQPRRNACGCGMKIYRRLDGIYTDVIKHFG